MGLTYDGLRVDLGFRAGMLINNAVLVELKSIERCAPAHQKQALTHVRLSGMRLGLLINSEPH